METCKHCGAEVDFVCRDINTLQKIYVDPGNKEVITGKGEIFFGQVPHIWTCQSSEGEKWRRKRLEERKKKLKV